MKRIICFEIRFDDGREGHRASREAKQAEVAAKSAAKAAAEAVIRSAGMKVHFRPRARVFVSALAAQPFATRTRRSADFLATFWRRSAANLAC
jgi:hypothetical protein